MPNKPNNEGAKLALNEGAHYHTDQALEHNVQARNYNREANEHINIAKQANDPRQINLAEDAINNSIQHQELSRQHREKATELITKLETLDD